MAYKRAFEDMFIQGAVHTVATVGIENTRTKDIASQTGFTEATMYRMFPTKESLLRDAFLYIDKRVSDIVTKNIYIRNPDKTPFELAMYAMWHRVYRYLIEHGKETVFMIRYRYSSYYTEEIRNSRELYNGAMDQVYETFERELGAGAETDWAMRLDSAFDLMLCCAERIVTGQAADSDETELGIWNVVSNAMKAK